MCKLIISSLMKLFPSLSQDILIPFGKIHFPNICTNYSAFPMSSTDLIDNNPVPFSKPIIFLIKLLVLYFIYQSLCINYLILLSYASYHHLHIVHKISRYLRNIKIFHIMVDSSFTFWYINPHEFIVRFIYHY